MSPLRVSLTAHLVAAVAAQRNGQPTVAHEELVVALARAAPQRALRLVLEVAPEVADILAAGAGRFGELEPFVLELRAHARAVSGSLRAGPVLDVALSARELSLLRELPSLLTVAEIAEARAVSRNTVKTQLRSLFQKLGVGSRRDAVAAARRLGPPVAHGSPARGDARPGGRGTIETGASASDRRREGRRALRVHPGRAHPRRRPRGVPRAGGVDRRDRHHRFGHVRRRRRRPHLHGILDRFQDLGFTLLELRRLPD